MLVQYNKFEFNEAQYGPYPAKVSSDRVTDENAPIEVLSSGSSCFSTPNKLGPETWAGWVQERGLYFLGERDPRYVDLLQTSDPFRYNPGVKKGALVEARVGKGRWVYIGLGPLAAAARGYRRGVPPDGQPDQPALTAPDMKFAPEYVTCVLNENFEDAKAQFLVPLMRIHYAHLVMLTEQQNRPAGRRARPSGRRSTRSRQTTSGGSPTTAPTKISSSMSNG